MGVPLTTYMEAKALSLNALAEQASVTWRTARKAVRGKLQDAKTAREIAASFGRDADGDFIVDPASMLDLEPRAPKSTEAA